MDEIVEESNIEETAVQQEQKSDAWCLNDCVKTNMNLIQSKIEGISEMIGHAQIRQLDSWHISTYVASQYLKELKEKQDRHILLLTKVEEFYDNHSLLAVINKDNERIRLKNENLVEALSVYKSKLKQYCERIPDLMKTRNELKMELQFKETEVQKQILQRKLLRRDKEIRENSKDLVKQYYSQYSERSCNCKSDRMSSIDSTRCVNYLRQPIRYEQQFRGEDEKHNLTLNSNQDAVHSYRDNYSRRNGSESKRNRRSTTLNGAEMSPIIRNARYQLAAISKVFNKPYVKKKQQEQYRRFSYFKEMEREKSKGSNLMVNSVDFALNTTESRQLIFNLSEISQSTQLNNSSKYTSPQREKCLQLSQILQEQIPSGRSLVKQYDERRGRMIQIEQQIRKGNELIDHHSQAINKAVSQMEKIDSLFEECTSVSYKNQLRSKEAKVAIQIKPNRAYFIKRKVQQHKEIDEGISRFMKLNVEEIFEMILRNPKAQEGLNNMFRVKKKQMQFMIQQLPNEQCV